MDGNIFRDGKSHGSASFHHRTGRQIAGNQVKGGNAADIGKHTYLFFPCRQKSGFVYSNTVYGVGKTIARRAGVHGRRSGEQHCRGAAAFVGGEKID